MSENAFLIEMGKRIANRRRELFMTQEQVAEQVDLSLQSISCIELGKKAVRPQNLLNICRVLNTSCDYILTGKKSKEQIETTILKKLAALKDDDYKMVEHLIDHLSERS